MDTELVYLSAVEARRRFAAGTLSPQELMTAVIERAEEVEPSVNAFTDTFFEPALEQAREAERRYATGTARPLEGLPVAIKEEQPIAGLPLREGSALTEGDIAEVTHPAVERIRAAGGILHARTTTPEFCTAGFTHSELWGVTRTPWRLECSSGGSSGGSGAALAAGTAALATGSDIAGSIRIPAAFNGVTGFKPPYGRVPALPPYNLDHYCHDGPLARGPQDCALLGNVIAGRHPVDPTSVPAPEFCVAAVADRARGMRVALCTRLGDYPVEPSVAGALQQAVEGLREQGVHVEEIELPWRRAEIMHAAWAHYGAILAAMVRETMAERGSGILPYTKEFVERGEAAFAELGRYGSVRTEARVQADLANVFARFDALLCPTTGMESLRAGLDYVDEPIIVDGVDAGHNLDAAMCAPFNLASRCPVVAVPAALADSGMPLGAQVVAAPFADQSAFTIAAAVWAALPWYAEAPYFPGGIG
ncbi:amidase [Sciscionella marina]|uniref:amidase n=1 Tax=Sciscionella marina TaxID=508770 RepID=UPI00036D19A6|nr:amidase [Sciscionella marina]